MREVAGRQYPLSGEDRSAGDAGGNCAFCQNQDWRDFQDFASPNLRFSP